MPKLTKDTGPRGEESPVLVGRHGDLARTTAVVARNLEAGAAS